MSASSGSPRRAGCARRADSDSSASILMLRQCWSNIDSMPWPAQVFASVPRSPRAHALARAVREAANIEPAAPLLDLRPICRAGRFRVVVKRLSASHAGVEALLSPEPGDRFEIWVDPEPRGGWGRVAATVKPELKRHRTRFRIAHEIGHAFFYERSGGTPRRIAPDSPQQEVFADTFARSLLLPPPALTAAAPVPESAIRLQREYDVSLEVAVRALACAYPSARWGLKYWPEGIDQEPSLAIDQWCSPHGLDRPKAPTSRGPAHRRSPARREVRMAHARARRQLVWTELPA
jgi:hypothetical protein